VRGDFYKTLQGWDHVEILNLIGSICSIVSLFIAIFIASKVYKINVSITSSKSAPTKSEQEGNIAGGDIAGRDITKK